MLQMKLCGDLVLREKCSPVADITPSLLNTMDEMVKMMQSQNGVGLAAPQVGITQRFLVMMDPDTNEIYRMINPQILSKSAETVVMEEGCLCRPASVDVEWTNEKGETLRAKMSGVPARIVQHETDHLDGILFIDYLSGVKREMLMRKVNRGHK